MIIALLSAVILVFLAVALFLLFKFRIIKRPYWFNRQSGAKTFVFTEDVDMGSSFVSRVRGRFSQLWATSASVITGRRTPWSFRGDKMVRADQEQRSSYDMLTSPRVSLAPSMIRSPLSLPEEDAKTRSWTYFMNEFLEPTGKAQPDLEKQALTEDDEHITSKHPSFMAGFLSVPFPATAHLRSPNPDAPVSAKTGSRILLGSGYLSSRSSRQTTSTTTQTGTRSTRPPTSQFLLPQLKEGSEGERLSVSNISSGYMSSRSSCAYPAGSPTSDRHTLGPNGRIYVSPAKTPASDVDILASSIGLPAEGVRRGPGRIPPFPTTSQRNSKPLD